MRALILEECTWKKSELNTILPENADSRKSVLMHKNRNRLFVEMNRGGGYRGTVKGNCPLFIW